MTVLPSFSRAVVMARSSVPLRTSYNPAAWEGSLRVVPEVGLIPVRLADLTRNPFVTQIGLEKDISNPKTKKEVP